MPQEAIERVSALGRHHQMLKTLTFTDRYGQEIPDMDDDVDDDHDSDYNPDSNSDDDHSTFSYDASSVSSYDSDDDDDDNDKGTTTIDVDQF
jgi:hypothetical protein